MSAARSIHTAIWREEPESDNPYAPRVAYCRGYDVFGEMVGHARWCEMLFLLFRGERPAANACNALEALAVALANPGPRDPSVHAAMCGGIGGATAAAALMAALAVGAGRHGGAREVRDAMLGWTRHGENIDAWAGHADTTDQIDVWPDAKHVPGFDPHGASTPLSVVQLLAQLAKLAGTSHLNWLARCRAHLESAIGLPLAMTGIAAATFADLGFTPDEGEMLYLLLRLPGAAAHALEQQAKSYKDFPFPEVILEDDPARGGA